MALRKVVWVVLLFAAMCACVCTRVCVYIMHMHVCMCVRVYVLPLRIWAEFIILDASQEISLAWNGL